MMYVLIAGRRQFSIRLGDVHAALGYKSQPSLVCSAIGAVTFIEENGLNRIAIDGPMNGQHHNLPVQV
jgi:hypothetical protein